MYGKPGKLGIFGGCFNPIHKGHILIAEKAAEEFGLDQVLFVPNPNPPHKEAPGMPSPDIQARMTARAIAGNPRFGLSVYELRRQYDCFTWNTLMHFREKYPEDELYFIMGADSLRDFPTWKKPAVISSFAVLCVACRDELIDEGLQELARRRAREYHADIRLISCPQAEISSTRLREMIMEGKKEADRWLPAGVGDIIRENGLYRPPEDPAAEPDTDERIPQADHCRPDGPAAETDQGAQDTPMQENERADAG